MNIDFYRLAFNVFHRNWIKFGIPEADIPHPKTETSCFLDLITPGFSKAVAFFQIASRKDLNKTFDNLLSRIHNLDDLYTCFENIMKDVLPAHTAVVILPQQTVEEAPSRFNMVRQPNDTMDENISEETTEESSKEKLSKETVEKDQPTMKESLSTDNVIFSTDVPAFIAYSLAVCTKIILYKYPVNKNYMKNLPDLWESYFNKHLKSLLMEADCNPNLLKEYIDGIKCPDDFLDKFIEEHKAEYDDIDIKFLKFTDKNYAENSPEHGKSLIEVEKYPVRLSFSKMKAKFTALKEICNCVKSSPSEETPLLTDYSPCTPYSTPSSPENDWKASTTTVL